MDADRAFRAGILASGVRHLVRALHLAAEPVVGGEFVGAEDGVAVKPGEHQQIEHGTAGGCHDGGAGDAAALDGGEQHGFVGAATAHGVRAVFLPVLGPADVGLVASMTPDSGSGEPPASMARSRCSRCQQVRYWMPIFRDRLAALIGLAVLSMRYIAIYQCRSSRRVPSMAVPTVTLNWVPQPRQRNRPGRLVTGLASLTTPHFGHAGPSGQQTLCMWARQASSVP